jgi:hypothetical protein
MNHCTSMLTSSITRNDFSFVQEEKSADKSHHSLRETHHCQKSNYHNPDRFCQSSRAYQSPEGIQETSVRAYQGSVQMNHGDDTRVLGASNLKFRSPDRTMQNQGLNPSQQSANTTIQSANRQPINTTTVNARAGRDQVT